jgi:hypothetical protein
MVNPQASLSDHMEALCGHCGAKIWSYPTPNGGHVPLDNAAGPYVIVGTRAYKSDGMDGYQRHLDHCKPFAEWRLTSQVSDDDFLWP